MNIGILRGSELWQLVENSQCPFFWLWSYGDGNSIFLPSILCVHVRKFWAAVRKNKKLATVKLTPASCSPGNKLAQMSYVCILW